MESPIEKDAILSEYNIKKDNYERLGQNLVEAIKAFLKENDIPFLDVYYRTKKFNSFFEKIDRKGYSNPFEEIEDFCGVRVICYYISDIDKINHIINKEFEVLNVQNKADLLGLKEFAYRSQHYIVKILDSWNAAPNYRGLEGLKCEIQVRTILMHAWAEIEHKLNYKSDAQVPDKFKRKLFRLSAKFEEADEQFEELRIGVDEYKRKLVDSLTNSQTFNIQQDFNINSFDAYLKFKFPSSKLSNTILNNSFELYNKAGIHFEEMEKILDNINPHIQEITNDLVTNGYISIKDYPSDILAFALDVYDDSFFNNRKSKLVTSWKKTVLKWQEKIR